MPLRFGGAVTPVAVQTLKGEQPGAPPFGCDARSLGCNRLGGFTGKVAHDLPTDGWVGIKKPLEFRGQRRIIVQPHWSIIATGVYV
jgi:hypothetical protein